MSSEAIKTVEPLIGNVRFELADFEVWDRPEHFDILVFNESLYYAKRPVDVLLRYRKFLKEDGSIIISIYQTGYRWAIWKSLDKWFWVVHTTTVKNAIGQTFDIG